MKYAVYYTGKIGSTDVTVNGQKALNELLYKLKQNNCPVTDVYKIYPNELVPFKDYEEPRLPNYYIFSYVEYDFEVTNFGRENQTSAKKRKGKSYIAVYGKTLATARAVVKIYMTDVKIQYERNLDYTNDLHLIRNGVRPLVILS